MWHDRGVRVTVIIILQHTNILNQYLTETILCVNYIRIKKELLPKSAIFICIHIIALLVKIGFSQKSLTFIAPL